MEQLPRGKTETKRRRDQTRDLTDAPVTVLGDINQCNLETMLQGFEQYVNNNNNNNSETNKKNNILDKCFVNVTDAYVSSPPILNSDTFF